MRRTRRVRDMRPMLPVRYFGQTLRMALWHRDELDPRDIVRSLPPWAVSNLRSSHAIGDGRPWITFGAGRYLDAVLPARAEVFEYGTGGSTVYFARRAARLVSVEHDTAWAEQVRETLDGTGDWTLHEAPPSEGHEPADPTDPDEAASSWFPGARFDDYVGKLDDYDAFDLVSVDGRARPACIARAMEHVKPGGMLMLDNSERRQYARGRRLLDAWERRDFFGPGPYNTYFWRTTIWRRPLAPA